MSWEIRSKNNDIKAICSKVEYSDEWLQECAVTVTIESPDPIDFQIGDYLIYRDERFEINYDPGKIKSAPRFTKGDAFKYENVKFNSLQDELTRCDFLDVVPEDNQLHFTGLPKFSFYGGVRSVAERIQANLDKTYPGMWTVVVSPDFSDTTELNVTVDTIKCDGALSIIVNDFKTYFTVKDRTITIGAAGVPADHLFKYRDGLYEIEQNAEADQRVVTRLRAYGSIRNIPHRYYNSLTGSDGKKLIPDNMAVQYLMLPSFPYTTQDPYIDSKNIDAIGIREDSIFFDGSNSDLPEIYPTIEGMTAEQLKAAGVPCNAEGVLDVLIGAEQIEDNGVGVVDGNETKPANNKNTFKVTLKDLGFDINDHLSTETPTISFKSGKLGGREFEIVECKKEGNNYILELNRVYDDSIQLWFPYNDYNAEAGDKFVLLNIEMPEVYIKAASQRLLEAASEWLSKNDYSRSIYTPKIDEIFMQRQHDAAMASGGKIKSLHDTLRAGMLLLFEDDDLGIDAAIFIDRLTIIESEDAIPTYEVVLKEEKTVGTLEKMQNQIDSLSAGQGQGGGGYSASQIRNLINAYGGQQFLSKLKDDRSAGKITSDKGFDVGDFLAGVSGGRFAKDAETGQSILEVDKIYARVKAYFETLTTIETSSLAGKQYISPGGSIKCVKVEETESSYRCYFLSEQDGEKTETKFVVGDQAISEMFNAKVGTENKVNNHRYWRLVTAVNNDAYSDENGNHYGYIDLSKPDCEKDSDIPKEGDVIEQFGNRNDVTRRAAMIFSTVDLDSPSIKLLTGIGAGETNAEHYSIEKKDIISYGYDPVEGNAYFICYGNQYVGSRDGSTFVEFNEKKNEVNLHNVTLSIGSKIGDKTFKELLKSIEDSDYLREALNQSTVIDNGLVLTSAILLGRNTDLDRETWAGHNGLYANPKTIASWWGGDMIDKFYNAGGNALETPLIKGFASALVRMDGSAYWANGNIGFNNDGSGWLGNYENGIRFGTDGSMTFGNGIKIALNSGNEGLSETLETVVNFVNGLTNLFYPVDANGKRLTYKQLSSAKGLMADITLLSKGDLVSMATGEVTTPTFVTTEALEARLKDFTPSVGGLDMEALESYLTKNAYATQDWVKRQGFLTGVTGFLPLSGGTLSDALTIQCGADTKLAFNNTDGEKYSAIKFLESGTEYSRMIGYEHKFEFSKYIEAPKFVAQTADLCPNLNADLLDGYHANSLFRKGVGRLTDASQFDTIYDCQTNVIYSLNGVFEEPYGTVLTFNSGLYNFGGQFFLPRSPSTSSHIFYRGKADINNTWSPWRKIAFLDDNVASATKLATPRSIWGQSFDGTGDINNTITLNHSDYHAINLRRTTIGGYGCSISCTIGDGTYVGDFGFDGTKFFNVRNASGASLIAALQNGNVGIGTVAPEYPLHVIGTIYASGNVTALSDIRVKEHITDLTWRGRLQPKRYWKDNRWQIGFIAQEVDPIVPEAVFKNDLWSLDYGGLVAYSILQGNRNEDDIENLKSRVKALEDENQQLRKLLSA